MRCACSSRGMRLRDLSGLNIELAQVVVGVDSRCGSSSSALRNCSPAKSDFPEWRGSPPDWFGQPPSLASTGPRSRGALRLSHPATARRRPVPEARGPQSSSVHGVRALPVGPLPRRSVLRRIAPPPTETGDPASASDCLAAARKRRRAQPDSRTKNRQPKPRPLAHRSSLR